MILSIITFTFPNPFLESLLYFIDNKQHHLQSKEISVAVRMVSEAEIKRLDAVFGKMEPWMAEEVLGRMGGSFDPDNPVYSGWSTQEIEEERARKREVAKDEQVFEDFVEQFGEYEQEKEEYREILRQEKKGGDKVQEKGRKARRKRNKQQESAKGERPEMKKNPRSVKKDQLMAKLSLLESQEKAEEREILLLREQGGQINGEGAKLGLEQMELAMEMKKIDEEVTDLMARKVAAHERYQESIKEGEDLDEKHDQVRIALLTLAKKSKGTLRLIKLVREKLQQNEDEEVVPGSGAETEMMAILGRQIKEMEEELECPVCLEVCQPGPIFKCSEDHLVCRDCTPRMTECPMCREEFTLATSKRFRGAERQAERLVALKKQLQYRPLE